MTVRRPDPVGAWALAAASATWAGAAAGRTGTPAAWLVAGGVGSVLVAAGALRSRHRGALAVLSVVLLLGVFAGRHSTIRDARTMATVVPEGPLTVAGRVVRDAVPGSAGVTFLFDPAEVEFDHRRSAWRGPRLLVRARGEHDWAAGDLVTIAGQVTGGAGRWRGDVYAAALTAHRVAPGPEPAAPLFRLANAFRDRVRRGLAAWHAGETDTRSAAGLVAGFLIGETSRVDPVDADALRRAGLSHYVAVSGSNVALFLALWWVVVGPLALGPRRRAFAGAAGVVLFTVVTRWEPSVLRAAAMAVVALTARALGAPMTAWTALGAATTGLLLVSPELTGSVGFQLSVAATLGVLGGAGWFEGCRPAPLRAALAASAGAQAAVAPVLLAHFGSLPVLSPLANVIAAPAVAAATVTGAIGLGMGWEPPLRLAVGAARFVVMVAGHAAAWPQVGWWAATGVAALAVLVSTVSRRTRRRARTALVVAIGTLLLAGVVGQQMGTDRPAVVFLDVGQGDAALVLGEDGATILVDGGPDPARMVRALDRHGVERLDLVILSHPHEDHVAGLVAVLDRYPVGTLWHPGFRDSGSTFDRLVGVARAGGVPVEIPAPGARREVGSVELVVLGPLRRYASPNDQSIVALVHVAGTRVLFPGDIEEIAQRELGPVAADIMKVPHQGAATSDLDWLAGSVPRLAVISVGPNDYGHPSAGVIAALSGAGATVRRTDVDGDVVVPLPFPVATTLVR